jgi:membrane fusion protein, multidrug efflux system
VHGRNERWSGRIVRVESAIDSETRQLMAVAQVDDPFAHRSDGSPPLRIGQFVEAEIIGTRLDKVFTIPRSAVRAGNEVILISAAPRRTLRRLTIEPLTADDKTVIVAADQPKGLKTGDVLCLTPIPFPADGARVDATVDGVRDPKPLAGNGSSGGKPDAKSQASAGH